MYIYIYIDVCVCVCVSALLFLQSSCKSSFGIVWPPKHQAVIVYSVRVGCDFCEVYYVFRSLTGELLLFRLEVSPS